MSAEKCPCCSGKSYVDCCEPLIKNLRTAADAVEMMRSRYTAYVKVEMDHLIRSMHPDHRGGHNKKAAKKWAENAEWLGLEIVESKPGEKKNEQLVEFIAKYREKNMNHNHHEVALFKKVKGEWYFTDSHVVQPGTFVREEAKVGRNDPCPCKSGKKYKKCCG